MQKLDKQGRAYATGKRKNAVARVWIKPGTGKITVNGRDVEVYFARPVLRMILQQPLGVAKRAGQYDVVVTVAGGGLSGQAGAVRHGLAKALTNYEPELRARAQEGRLPHPRLPRGRAQEIRQAQSPPQLPVLEALSARELPNKAAPRARLFVLARKPPPPTQPRPASPAHGTRRRRPRATRRGRSAARAPRASADP